MRKNQYYYLQAGASRVDECWTEDEYDFTESHYAYLPVKGVVIQPNVEDPVNLEIVCWGKVSSDFIQLSEYDQGVYNHPECDKGYCNRETEDLMLANETFNACIFLKIAFAVFVVGAHENRETLCDNRGVPQHDYHKSSDKYSFLDGYSNWFCIFFIIILRLLLLYCFVSVFNTASHWWALRVNHIDLKTFLIFSLLSHEIPHIEEQNPQGDRDGYQNKGRNPAEDHLKEKRVNPLYIKLHYEAIVRKEVVGCACNDWDIWKQCLDSLRPFKLEILH